MIRRFLAVAAMAMIFVPASCSEPLGNDAADGDETTEVFNMKIDVKVGGRVFAATLEDNAAAREFASRLPLTLSMSELNGNEKYCYLDKPLPAAAKSVSTIESGDLMLWQSNCVVLFYKTFSSGYSYTRLGRLDSAEGIAEAVGRGEVSVTFESRE